MTKLKIAGALLLATLLPVSVASAAPTVPPNPASDYLQALSGKDQAALLGKSVGRFCAGKTAFYMGMGIERGTRSLAFWSVKCGNGASYVVEVAPDGSNQALTCTGYEANNVGKCFKKFPGQEDK